jgi:hypothetical protein
LGKGDGEISFLCVTRSQHICFPNTSR